MGCRVALFCLQMRKILIFVLYYWLLYLIKKQYWSHLSQNRVILTLFTWFLHDFYMKSTWFLHDFYMIFTWFLHDFYMIFTWFLHDFYMIFTWFLHDFYMIFNMVFTWFLHDFYMIFTKRVRIQLSTQRQQSSKKMMAPDAIAAFILPNKQW